MTDNGLAAGGFLTVSAPSDLTLAGTTCNMWVLGETATAPAAGSTSWLAGSFTAATGVCTLGASTTIAAGAAMGMTIGATASKAGSFAPIGL